MISFHASSKCLNEINQLPLKLIHFRDYKQKLNEKGDIKNFIFAPQMIAFLIRFINQVYSVARRNTQQYWYNISDGDC
jgi:hypothetical protein